MITSRVRRETSPVFIPLSIASCTRSSPTTGPAAPSMAITARKATRPHCPCKEKPSRLRPVLRGCKDLVSEESPEDDVAAQQFSEGSVLLDDSVHEHHGAFGHLHRREALRR